MAFPWAAAAGGVMSYFSSASQRKQSNKMYDLFAPGVKRGQQTQAALLDWLLPQLGKGDRTLTTQYERGAAGIKQAGARNVRRSRLYWAQQGNVGRARGEEMRSRLATRSALGGLALDYASRSRAAKMSLVAPIAEIGQMGMGGGGYMAEALMGKAQAAQGFWEDLAILGSRWQAEQDWKKTQTATA